MNRKKAITINILLAITISLALTPIVSAPTPQPSIIFGYKWEDINGDGIWGIEPTLNGWTIDLWKYDEGLTEWNLESSVITGDGAWADGYYEFTNLPAGEYRIQETTPLGWTQTHPSSPNYYPLSVEEGTTYGPYNFGNFEYADVTVRKVDSEGEPVENWEVYVDSQTAYTDPDGYAYFTITQPGSYTVSEESRAGWTPIGETSYPVLVESGGSYGPFEFTNEYEGGTVIVEKKIDWGINSQYMNGWAFDFYPNWGDMFTLYDGDQYHSTLPQGTYIVIEDIPDGWTTEIKIEGNGWSQDVDGNTAEFNLDPCETVTITFTNRPPDFVIPETPFGTLLILAVMIVAYLMNNKQMIPLPK
jgi:hypothetical protein